MFEVVTATVNRAVDASYFLFPSSQKDGEKRNKRRDDKLVVLIHFSDVSRVPKKMVI